MYETSSTSLPSKLLSPVSSLLNLICISCQTALMQFSCLLFAVQKVLEMLERPYADHQAACSSDQGPVQVPQVTVRGVQLASALRHLLHPSKLLPKKSQVILFFFCMRLGSK